MLPFFCRLFCSSCVVPSSLPLCTHHQVVDTLLTLIGYLWVSLGGKNGKFMIEDQGGTKEDNRAKMLQFSLNGEVSGYGLHTCYLLTVYRCLSVFNINDAFNFRRITLGVLCQTNQVHHCHSIVTSVQKKQEETSGFGLFSFLLCTFTQ